MSGKQSVSQLAKMLEQYWAGRSGATAGDVAGNGVTDHHQLTGLKRDDHPHYLTNIRGDARYSLKSDPSVQEHDVIGTFHSVDGSQYDIVGLTATDTLGLLTPGSDISSGNTILISDASGNATIGVLTASSVATPAITSAADLTLTTTGDILTDNTLSTTDWASGVSGAGINFDTGVGDFRSITADELIVEAFIAAVKRAHVGALIVTKSMSLTTQAFTIPAAGSTSTLYIADIPGFGGMEAFADGDDVAIPYVGTEEAYTPSHVTTSWGTDDGAGGGATVHYGEEDFEGFSIGGDPTDWYDTGTGNGMTLSDLCDVQSVGGSQAFGTTNSGSNFHTHWNGTGYATLDDYRYTGRFRIGDSSNGIGFTVLSQYASGGTDEYYRVRRYSGGTSFYVANHGDYESNMTGDTDSGYNPSADTWHKFKIEVEDTGTQTELRAKFWADGASEPSTWQIDCYDDSTDRGTAGTFGLWLHSDADGAYVDDIKVESLTGTSTSVTVPIDVETDDVVIAAVHAPTASTFTPAASWTLITSQAYGTDTVRWYRFTATSDGELNSTWGIDTGVLQVHLVATRYINTSDIVEASSAGAFSSVSSFAAPSLTVAGTDSALLILAMNDQYSGVTAPDGMIVRGLQPTTADSRSAVMSAVVEDSGSTGIKTVGYGGATSGAYLVIALNKKTGTRTDGLVVGTAWGTVEPDTVSSVEADEQAWLFTTATDSLGAGIVVQPDSVVLDYGTVGDGYVEITTLDPSGSPYMQIATRGANPRTQQTVQLRAGNLDGISGADGTWGLYVAGDVGKLEMSDEIFELANIPMSMTDSDIQYLSLGVSDGITIYRPGSEIFTAKTALKFRDQDTDELVGYVTAVLQDPEDAAEQARMNIQAQHSTSGAGAYVGGKGATGKESVGCLYALNAAQDGPILWMKITAASKGTVEFYGVDTFEIGDMFALDVAADTIDLVGTTHTYTAISTFSTNWSNYGGSVSTAGYSKSGNMVELRGRVTCSASWSSGDTMATLPAGYRPDGGTDSYAVSYSGGFARVDVLTTGAIKVYVAGTSSQWVSLAGISFATA